MEATMTSAKASIAQEEGLIRYDILRVRRTITQNRTRSPAITHTHRETERTTTNSFFSRYSRQRKISDVTRKHVTIKNGEMQLKWWWKLHVIWKHIRPCFRPCPNGRILRQVRKGNERKIRTCPSVPQMRTCCLHRIIVIVFVTQILTWTFRKCRVSSEFCGETWTRKPRHRTWCS